MKYFFPIALFFLLGCNKHVLDTDRSIFIQKLDALKFQLNSRYYHHEKGTHIHYFRHIASNLYNIVNTFNNFEIDDDVIEIYNQQKQIIENKFDYIPYLTPDNSFKNIDIENNKSFLQNVDSAIKYGYHVPSLHDTTNCLEEISYRNNQLIYIEKYSLKTVLETLNTLNKYPIIALIDEDNSYEQVKEIHNSFKPYVETSKQSVLFRIESSNSKDLPLNQYIKNNELNNWVDENTKVVYIKKNKLPKILLKSNFKPSCALSLTSIRSHNTLKTYCVFNCDCYIMFDNVKNMYFKGNEIANLQTYN